MWRYLKSYFLFCQPWRRVLIKLSYYLPGKWQERLRNALYPDDLLIEFLGGGD